MRNSASRLSLAVAALALALSTPARALSGDDSGGAIIIMYVIIIAAYVLGAAAILAAIGAVFGLFAGAFIGRKVWWVLGTAFFSSVALVWGVVLLLLLALLSAELDVSNPGTILFLASGAVGLMVFVGGGIALAVMARKGQPRKRIVAAALVPIGTFLAAASVVVYYAYVVLEPLLS